MAQRRQQARALAAAAQQDRRGIRVGHDAGWDNGNQNYKPVPETKKSQERALFKDPNVMDVEEIVITKEFVSDDKQVNLANEKWVEHLNSIRKCRNDFLEASNTFTGKQLGKELAKVAKKFALLKGQCDGKVLSVIKLKGTPVPFPGHMKTLPSLSGKGKGFLEK